MRVLRCSADQAHPEHLDTSCLGQVFRPHLQAHSVTNLHLACLNVHVVSHGIYHTNNYLVDDGISGEALLIDATENPALLIAEAESRSLRLVAIVATHSHFDHVGGVAGVKERLQDPPLAGT